MIGVGRCVCPILASADKLEPGRHHARQDPTSKHGSFTHVRASYKDFLKTLPVFLGYQHGYLLVVYRIRLCHRRRRVGFRQAFRCICLSVFFSPVVLRRCFSVFSVQCRDISIPFQPLETSALAKSVMPYFFVRLLHC